MQKKTVFVTGGSRGIGRAIADWFIKRDYNVIIGFYKNFEYKKSPLREKNVFSAMVDIKNRKSIIDAINISENYFKTTIDVLINNAAISQEKDFNKISDKDWDIMLATNLRGVFSFTQEVIPKMIKKRWGRIINISSVGGQWGGFNQVHYAASKAGVINFTKSIAKIYSEYGI
ncbi:MAG: SDR family NAD(P)-dependent oxidoreductase, partial [Pseudomonadota bacterium]|nr:SDR family NAD(P)-dependent oxidoreductase [Pseudomonadota bacterium]